MAHQISNGISGSFESSCLMIRFFNIGIANDPTNLFEVAANWLLTITLVSVAASAASLAASVEETFLWSPIKRTDHSRT